MGACGFRSTWLHHRAYNLDSNRKCETRVLKEPQFFVSSLFLKKPSRIQGLLTIMTFALLVYSIAERRMRKALKETKQTLPNQINQPTTTPTLRLSESY